MILGLDTDYVVNLAIAGAPGHEAAQRFLEGQLSGESPRFGLTQQVIWELIHVVTDARRFPRPLTMSAALAYAEQLWHAREVRIIHPAPHLVRRVLQLLGEHQLGRKRIHDTVLAATYEAAGIRQIVTFNPKDFAVFPFLETITPD